MQVLRRVHSKSRECETLSDTELVHRFKMGDESAFSTIVLRYKDRFVRIAQNLLGDESEAMDLSQDAFVKAYYSIKSFREDSSLYTWLYRILYNLCISALRRRKIISFVSFEDREETREFISGNPSPEEDIERKEFRTAVAEAIKKLPERQRMVFVMKQTDGLKHEEIAGIIGITEGAVKASYFQAVKKLQNYLKQYGDSYGM